MLGTMMRGLAAGLIAPAAITAPAIAQAPAPRPLSAEKAALDAALNEQAELERAGFSRRYAFASALGRLVAEYPQYGARSAGRKLRSWAGQIMAREQG